MNIRVWQWPLVVLVSALNVAMNALLKKAATLAGVRSGVFATAVITGTATMAVLFLLYRSGLPFAQAMLLMGATSVLLGVSWGVLRGDRLHPLEVGVLVLLLLFYVTAGVVRR